MAAEQGRGGMPPFQGRLCLADGSTPFMDILVPRICLFIWENNPLAPSQMGEFGVGYAYRRLGWFPPTTRSSLFRGLLLRVDRAMLMDRINKYENREPGVSAMTHVQGRTKLRPKSVANRLVQRWKLNPNYYFARDVLRLIWGHKAFGVAIIIITVIQEIVALWPVSLLGQFVDRLSSGDIGNVVWLFLGASILSPTIVRGNVILRHKMFYETDYQKRVEMTLRVAEQGDSASDAEQAGSAHTRVVNAVSGITNATYHVLGSFIPVIIKIAVVSGNLLTYNRMLGLAYLASLSVPILMTGVFNSKMQVLRDAQYEVISEASGSGIRAISEKGSETACEHFLQIMRDRTVILFNLLLKSQLFLHAREVALIGSQFLIIFMALGLREKLRLTPGDFTKIIGYTTQVATAFITTASTLDAIISYSRAYHVYAQAHGN